MNKLFRYSARFKERLEALGISFPMVLRHAGLRRDLFDEQRVLLSTEELFALWRAVESISKDPGLGLKLGTATKTEQFSTSCIAALSTENLGAAITHLARYKRLTCPEEMPQEFAGSEWAIRFHWLLALEAEPQDSDGDVLRRSLVARTSWNGDKAVSAAAPVDTAWPGEGAGAPLRMPG